MPTPITSEQSAHLPPTQSSQARLSHSQGEQSQWDHSQGDQFQWEDACPTEVATAAQTLPLGEQLVVLQNLAPSIALETFRQFSLEHQHQLLQEFQQSSLGVILGATSASTLSTPIEAIENQLRQKENQLGQSSLQGNSEDNPKDISEDRSDDRLKDRSNDESEAYFETNLLLRIGRRMVWLVVLLLANTATTAVIHSQENVLQQVVALAAFIPLLIGSSGNVSTQSATIMVRALSNEQASWQLALKRIAEQALVAVFLGAILGIVATGIAIMLQGRWDVAIVVGISLFTVSIIAAISGSALPHIFKALGFDPALMSAPVSAILVDIVGVLIYLQLAQLMLRLV